MLLACASIIRVFAATNIGAVFVTGAFAAGIANLVASARNRE